ncbi:LINE-1 reverse transcriptase-like protein [Bienertia sinuspersici]
MECKENLKKVQEKCQKNLFDQNIIKEEQERLEEFKKVSRDYFSFLKQKSKISWLKAGDENTRFFDRSLKIHQYQKRVVGVKDINENWCEGRTAVAEAFEQYYKMLLGTEAKAIGVVQNEVIQAGQIISAEQAQCLMRPFSMEDVKNALFSIDGGKSPGPDGFNSSFFKLSWPILGNEISAVVLDFFQTGRLLREINNTNITLIPKVNNPMSVTDFRPIAYCNTIYKIISKMLCSRLKEILPDLISDYQSGFIKGRKIFHNICIIQDLIGKYKRKNSPPGCMFKVDIRKAYDSIRWEFLDQLLRKLNFPTQFVDWIMMCVSTPAFSLNINGETCGYFKGKRGLRQGDPISPLLFVICMDYLSRLLVLVGKNKGFDYHPRCKALGVSHLALQMTS